jgi:glutaredoxin
MMLILYVTQNCPNCPKVKQYLISKNISFDVKDAEKCYKECFEYGIQSIPSVRLGNDVLPIGNDLKKLSAWLRKRGLMGG